MNLLIDENLSWRLGNYLKDYFTVIISAREIGSEGPVKDSMIWDYALKNNFLILTNDDDFYKLSTLKGFPPKVILLKTGNMKTIFVANLLIKHIESIKSFYNNSEYGILEIVSVK